MAGCFRFWGALLLRSIETVSSKRCGALRLGSCVPISEAFVARAAYQIEPGHCSWFGFIPHERVRRL